jgi:methyl-accepting chemotaxis protein
LLAKIVQGEFAFMSKGKTFQKNRDSLLLKYGAAALSVIVVSIFVFLSIAIHITKKPIRSVYQDSIEAILNQSVDFAETWFDTQVEVLNSFQSAVVDGRTDIETIKENIRMKKKPNGFEYIMVFWDTDTNAKDGGPETYNTKGTVSKVGILSKEYWKMHKENDVLSWLESPRKSNAGGITMPLFVRSDFVDTKTNSYMHGGMVGFLELEPINKLAKVFYETGSVSVYDDNNELRAGEDILNAADKDAHFIYTKECNMGNKKWTVVASIEKNEVNGITAFLSRIFVIGGIIVSVCLMFSVLLIIKLIIGKFDQIKKNIDNLNTGDKDLTKRLEVKHNNEISQVKQSVNNFVSTVHETVKEIRNSNDYMNTTFANVKNQLDSANAEIDSMNDAIQSAKLNLDAEDDCVLDTTKAVGQISSSIKGLNDLITSQSNAITQASASIEEMIGNIQSVSHSVLKMSKEFDDLNVATIDGIEKNKIVNELLGIVLNQSKSLQDTNTVISDISSQTNLLSMNAMIESAHAGEAGKGFAVVADEIRKLADTSAAQSKSIGENLQKVSENINKVVESANASKLSFELVAEKSKNTSELVDSIRRAMEEQSEGSKQILEFLSSMNNISGSVQSSSHEIESKTNQIVTSVSSLKEATEKMSDNFRRIVATNKSTKDATVNLLQTSDELNHAVNDISRKVGVFKI